MEKRMKNHSYKYTFGIGVGLLLGTMILNVGAQTNNIKAAKAAGSPPVSISSLPSTINLNDYTEIEVRSYYSSLNSLSTTERQGTNLLKNLKPILYYDTRYLSYEAVWKTGIITDRNWNRSPASSIGSGTYNASTGIVSNYVYSSNGENDDPYLHLLYRNDGDTNEMKASSSHSSSYNGINREHIWPQSRGFKASSGASGPAGTDVHHLLLADARVNQVHHNNYSYGNVTNPSVSEDRDGIGGNYRGIGPLSSTVEVFEPQDADKGDIARACFYMVARYNNYAGTSGAISAYEPFLILDDGVDTNGASVTSSDTTPASYASLSTLLEWNREDPVDAYEIHRNNLIARNYQYNRNPFVDYPNWAEYIWGNAQTSYATPATDSCTSGNSSVISVTGISLNKSSTLLNVGETEQLVETIVPSNATNKNVSWSSNNTGVATVSNSGLLTAIASGTATITVTTSDGGFVATCVVDVAAPEFGTLDSIAISTPATTLSFNVGDTFDSGGLVLRATDTNSVTKLVASGYVTNLDGYIFKIADLGTNMVTVSYTENGITKNCNYAISVFDGSFSPTTIYGTEEATTATLVSNVSNLALGDNIIIANTSKNVALGPANGTYRSKVDVAITGNKITDLTGATILTLGGNSSAWTLSNQTEYLYYTGTGNTLQTGTSSSTGNTWTIAISSGSATITNVSSSTRVIQYNSSSPRFACYTSTQLNPNVYKMDPAINKYNYDYLLDVLDGDYCAMNLDGLDLINARYTEMTLNEKNHFNVESIVGLDTNTYTGLEAYNFAMARRAILLNEAIRLTNFDSILGESHLVALVTIVSIVSLSIGGGMLYLKRKERE